MKNRTLALWIAVGAFSIQHSAFSVAAAAEPPARTPKALVIMLDGLRADAVENVAGAASLRMLRDGAWRPEYGCAWSLAANTILDAPTMSGPNHVSIACGVTAAKHRVLRNQKNTCDHGRWPSWLVRLADARPEAKTLFAFAWDWDQDLSPDPRVEFVYGKDDENARTVAGRLADPDGPDAVQWFIDRIDHAGHLSGFYPYAERYTNEVARADRTIGRALEAIASRPTFADEDWLIVVTADHGGYHKNHGQMNGPATTIPLLVVGRDVARGRMAGTPHDCDVAPTVLAHFGVDASGMDLDGRVIGRDPAASDRARPLRDGLAAYLPFDGGAPANAVAGGPKVVALADVLQAHFGIDAAKGGFAGGYLRLATNAVGGVRLEGSETLGFENGGDFALALWLRMDATQEVHSAFAGSKGLERPEEPGVALAAGKDVRFNAGLAGGGAFDLKPYDIETGAWTFYAVTRSSDGVVRFYQGGQDGNLYWMSENADISLAAGTPFCVGSVGADDASRFAGDIDDFALWTRALSHEDVRRIYEAGLKGAPLGDLL